MEVLRALHEKHGDKVAWLNIYVREAHTKREWALQASEVMVDQPRALPERLELANQFCARHPMPFPLVVDDVTDEAALAYDALPEKLVLLEDGKVTFLSGQGPHKYLPHELAAVLEQRFDTGAAAAAARRDS